MVDVRDRALLLVGFATALRRSELVALDVEHGLFERGLRSGVDRVLRLRGGVSPSVITRLTAQWQAERRAFMDRDLSDRDYLYRLLGRCAGPTPWE